MYVAVKEITRNVRRNSHTGIYKNGRVVERLASYPG